MAKIKLILICSIIALSLCAQGCSYEKKTQGSQTAQDAPQLKTMDIEIVDIRGTEPVTVGIRMKNPIGMPIESSFTIDPGCEFYVNNELSSDGVNSLKRGDKVKMEYVVSEGEKVAFKIYIIK